MIVGSCFWRSELLQIESIKLALVMLIGWGPLGSLRILQGNEDSSCSKIMRKGGHGHGVKVVLCKAYLSFLVARIV